jgi:hypothetical protein
MFTHQKPRSKPGKTPLVRVTSDLVAREYVSTSCVSVHLLPRITITINPRRSARGPLRDSDGAWVQLGAGGGAGVYDMVDTTRHLILRRASFPGLERVRSDLLAALYCTVLYCTVLVQSTQRTTPGPPTHRPGVQGWPAAIVAAGPGACIGGSGQVCGSPVRVRDMRVCHRAQFVSCWICTNACLAVAFRGDAAGQPPLFAARSVQSLGTEAGPGAPCTAHPLAQIPIQAPQKVDAAAAPDDDFDAVVVSVADGVCGAQFQLSVIRYWRAMAGNVKWRSKTGGNQYVVEASHTLSRWPI